MVSSGPISRPRQLKSTGMRIAPKAVSLNFSRRASPAGARREVWKGPLTFRGRQRLAPSSLASAAALSTAACSPPMTNWPGQL